MTKCKHLIKKYFAGKSHFTKFGHTVHVCVTYQYNNMYIIVSMNNMNITHPMLKESSSERGVAKFEKRRPS